MFRTFFLFQKIHMKTTNKEKQFSLKNNFTVFIFKVQYFQFIFFILIH